MAAGCEICCYFFKNLNQFRHFSAILFLFFLLECVEESLTRLTDKQLIYNRLCSISKSIIHQSHYILTLFTILQTPPSIIPSKCFLDDVSILGFITVYSVLVKSIRSRSKFLSGHSSVHKNYTVLERSFAVTAQLMVNMVRIGILGVA